MTDQTPETEAKPETLLSIEQRTRVEALGCARDLLLGVDQPNGLSAAFGSPSTTKSLGSEYVLDLQMLAEYVLNGMLAAEVEEVEAEVHEHPGHVVIGAIVTDMFDRIREHAKQEQAEKSDLETDLVDENGEARRATAADLERHAEKQDVSRRDAWNYFRDQGYDMTDVADYEFDSSVPNEEGN